MMLMMMAVEKWNICTRKNSITPKTLEHSELEQLEKRKKSNLINLLPFNMFTLWCGTAASWFFQSVLCTMRNAELALHSPTPFLSPITRKWLNRRVKCKNINLKSSQNFYYTSSSIKSSELLLLTMYYSLCNMFKINIKYYHCCVYVVLTYELSDLNLHSSRTQQIQSIWHSTLMNLWVGLVGVELKEHKSQLGKCLFRVQNSTSYYREIEAWMLSLSYIYFGT